MTAQDTCTQCRSTSSFPSLSPEHGLHTCTAQMIKILRNLLHRYTVQQPADDLFLRGKLIVQYRTKLLQIRKLTAE